MSLANVRRANEVEKQTTYVYQPPSHRLLYRGSLLIENSSLLLDGLSLSVPLGEASKFGNAHLIDNPLALALESMRGRSLLLLGDAQPQDMYLDRAGEVNVDIHPDAVITRLYFENQLCSRPITSPNGITGGAVRIAIGDPDNPETSEVLVYGQLPPASMSPTPVASSSASTLDQHLPGATSPPVLRLLAARILPDPPQTPSVRLPRPDDPSPRMPPPSLIYPGKHPAGDDDPRGSSTKRRKNSNDPSEKAKGKTKATLDDEEIIRHAREMRIPKGVGGATISNTAATIQGVNGKAKAKTVEFKIPPLPLEVRGETSNIVRELEKANKGVIKKASIDCVLACGIGKTHPEWKELWGFIYRGTEFALRAQMRTRAVDTRAVTKLVKAHAKLYIDDKDIP